MLKSHGWGAAKFKKKFFLFLQALRAPLGLCFASAHPRPRLMEQPQSGAQAALWQRGKANSDKHSNPEACVREGTDALLCVLPVNTGH